MTDQYGVLGAFDRLLRGQDAAMDVRKILEADETLTTQMMREAMSIGRTFREAFQKAIRSMEVERHGFGLDPLDPWLAHQH